MDGLGLADAIGLLRDAVSVKIFSHPYPVSSSIWLSSFWPRVDTRAYPIIVLEALDTKPTLLAKPLAL